MMQNKFGLYGEVLENADLTNYNTYGIKTSCDYLIKVKDEESLRELLVFLNNDDIKYFVVGGGSNIIFSDKHFHGVIISLEKLNGIKIEDVYVYAGAGVSLSKFILECINNNMGGLEELCLIPGSLGGALYGNAGCLGKCIYDCLDTITVLRDGKIITLLKNEVEYSYRHTEFKNNGDIILSAKFRLEHKDKNEMLNSVKENRIKRNSSQPLEYKNAGSVFKNPEGDYAGRLIESLNLKGYKIGGAEISTKHANFIINIDNATGKDIRELIKYIQDKVYDNYKIKLELEQIIVDWE